MLPSFIAALSIANEILLNFITVSWRQKSVSYGKL